MPNFKYQSHTSFTTPSDNIPVYHSINLEYLKESIKNKQLRFASVLSYKDSFEGRLPYRDEFSVSGNLMLDSENPIFGPGQILVNNILGGGIAPFGRLYPLKYFLDEWSNYIFSHCWSLNSSPWNENRDDLAVTIQSTIGNIKNAFCSDYYYHIGEVKYINYLIERLPSLERFFVNGQPSVDLLYERHLHKRLKYKPEQEIRLIISWESFIQKYPEVRQILPHNPDDRNEESEKLYPKDYLVYKKVDFSKLIEAIIVPPNIACEQLEDLQLILTESSIDLSVVSIQPNE